MGTGTAASHRSTARRGTGRRRSGYLRRGRRGLVALLAAALLAVGFAPLAAASPPRGAGGDAGRHTLGAPPTSRGAGDPRWATATTDPPSSSSTTSTSIATTTTTSPPATLAPVPRRKIPRIPTSGGTPVVAGRRSGSAGRRSGQAAGLSRAEVGSTLGAVTADIDRLSAIEDYQRLRTTLAVERRHLARLDGYVADTVQQERSARKVAAGAAGQLHASSGELAQFALAAYTGAAYVNPVAGPDAVEAKATPSVRVALSERIQQTAVMVSLLTTQLERQVGHDEAEVSSTRLAVERAVGVSTAARRLRASARRQLSETERDLTAAVAGATDPTIATATALSAAATSRSAGSGPTILGPSLVSASELAAWYRTTGSRPATTVPIGRLAADYQLAGRETGVRADIAFAQSIVETGYFTFPAGGQLTGGDNNFAGIGACDSCAHGWSFPTALTGVTAQLQLLEAYASPRPVRTPLIGAVGVGGCCPTWMALGGTWASNEAYGVEILGVYTRILEWVIPRQLAAAGLAHRAGGRV